MAIFFPKGETLMPYSRDLLEKAVAASNGRMKPGCKFKCTFYSQEKPSWYHLPVAFSCKFVELDEGIRISFRVLPGALVWLLLALPVVAIVALGLLRIQAEIAPAMGLLIAAVVFLFGFQRERAIERFVRRFGK